MRMVEQFQQQLLLLVVANRGLTLLFEEDRRIGETQGDQLVSVSKTSNKHSSNLIAAV